MSEGEARYMVLVQKGAETSSPALNVPRAKALGMTRELRAACMRAFIMRLDGECPELVVGIDEPLPDE